MVAANLPVVVGVDGSPESLTALNWAVDYARAAAKPLKIICAYEVAFPDPYSGTVLVEADEIEAIAKQELETIIGDVDVQGLDVDAVAVPGHPSAVLHEEAKAADLLVVGTRGRGGLSGLLLGSTSRGILHHAPCPVVVVPTEHAKL